MSNLNEQDLQARETMRQARPALMGSRLSGAAAAGASTNVPPAPSTTIVDEDGIVRRRWLVGDDWTNEFFFDWRPD